MSPFLFGGCNVIEKAIWDRPLIIRNIIFPNLCIKLIKSHQNTSKYTKLQLQYSFSSNLDNILPKIHNLKRKAVSNKQQVLIIVAMFDSEYCHVNN